MSWFKVDDGFHTDPAAITATWGALRIYLLAGAWSARHNTEGFIPDQSLRVFQDPHRNVRRSAAQAVECGLWKPALGGWEFAQWHGPSAAEIEDRRRRDRDRKRHLRSIPGGAE